MTATMLCSDCGKTSTYLPDSGWAPCACDRREYKPVIVEIDPVLARSYRMKTDRMFVIYDELSKLKERQIELHAELKIIQEDAQKTHRTMWDEFKKAIPDVDHYTKDLDLE